MKTFEEIKEWYGLSNGMPVTVGVVEKETGLNKEQIRKMVSRNTESQKALWEVGRIELNEFAVLVNVSRNMS